MSSLTGLLSALSPPVNVKELLGVLAVMGLIFSALWFGFPGPLFRYLLRRAAGNWRGNP